MTDVVTAISTSDDLSRGSTFKEIVSADIPEVSWVIPYTIPEGFTLRAGAPKDGKSAMSEWEACVLGVEHPVCYFALEYSKPMLAQRLHKLKEAGLNPQHARFWNQYEIQDGHLNPLDFIERMVRETQPLLVVIDTIVAVKQMTSGQYQDEYAAMQEVKAICDSVGTNLLANHHSKKMGDTKDDDTTNWVERLIGSTAIAASADTVQLLERVELSARLRMRGRMAPELDQYFGFNNGIFEPQDGADIAMKVLESDLPASAVIAYLLRDHEALTFTQVLTYVNEGLKPEAPSYRNKGAVYKSLETLKKRGLVVAATHRGGTWKWSGPN